MGNWNQVKAGGSVLGIGGTLSWIFSPFADEGDEVKRKKTLREMETKIYALLHPGCLATGDLQHGNDPQPK